MFNGSRSYGQLGYPGLSTNCTNSRTCNNLKVDDVPLPPSSSVILKYESKVVVQLTKALPVETLKAANASKWKGKTDSASFTVRYSSHFDAPVSAQMSV